MSGGVAISASMRQNLLALQKTTALQDMTQNRLATSRKVNSAIDNPSSYFTATALSNRASDLTARLDGIGQALQTLSATSNALDTLTTLVQQAKAIATSAAEAAGTETASLTSIAAKSVSTFTTGGVTTTTDTTLGTFLTYDSTATANFSFTINGASYTFTASVGFSASQDVAGLVTYLNSHAGFSANGITAAFNDVSNSIELMAAEGTSVTFESTTTGGDTNIQTLFGIGGSVNTITFGAAAATDGAAHAFGFSTTSTIMFTVVVTNPGTGASGQTVTISLTGDATIQQLLDALNDVDSGLTASFNTTTKKIEFAAEAGTTVYLGADTSGTASGKIFSTSIAATNASLTSMTSTTFGTYNSTSEVASLFNDFSTVMTQIDQAISDADYKGTNLLSGSATMTVKFNEDGSSKLTVTGVDFAYNSGLGFTTTSNVDWGAANGIQTTIDEAQAALTTIRSQAAAFGNANSIIQSREDFTNNLVETLSSGSDLLTLADMNEESANMLALQTQRQLATNALSMASQAAQSVLQLFR